MKSFNKDFFHFLSGFMGLVCVSLVIIFAVGFYESEIMGGEGQDSAITIQGK